MKLKIKDDVDLKELEKYGFTHNEYYDGGLHDVYYANGDYGRILIFVKGRVIYFEQIIDFARHSTELVILYNLIENDLIEKVEG